MRAALGGGRRRRKVKSFRADTDTLRGSSLSNEISFFLLVRCRQIKASPLRQPANHARCIRLSNHFLAKAKNMRKKQKNARAAPSTLLPVLAIKDLHPG